MLLYLLLLRAQDFHPRGQMLTPILYNHEEHKLTIK